VHERLAEPAVDRARRWPFEVSIARKRESVCAGPPAVCVAMSFPINVSNRNPVPAKRANHFGGFVDAAAVM
jgi:hypothetical protein